MGKIKNVFILFMLTAVVFVLSGCSDNALKSISIVQMPDVEGGPVGKGFTCTGLTYDKVEDAFYVGNIGKELPTTPGFKSTVVKLDKDFKTNLGEIDIYTVFPDMDDIQGLTIDYSDNTIWFCSFAENKIRNISKDGSDLGSIDIDRPTGIAYDSRNDSLWVLTTTSLRNITKSGDLVKNIDISRKGQDQLYLDEGNNRMYITSGNNYKGTNYVYKIDLSTDEISKAYALKDSYAVEGIHIEEDRMYILNDGYYHDGKLPINQVNEYDISKK